MSGLPVAKNQLRKLGTRLRESDEPDPADLELLYETLAAYQGAMDGVAETVSTATGLHPSRRLKTTGTIIDKLRRNPACPLGNIQDLAGVRVVVDTLSYEGQDITCSQLMTALGNSKLHDRRLAPSFGYGAIHIVTQHAGVPVEVQVRTTLQHQWAEIFEKMADVWGRGIRYGEPPQMPELPGDAPQILREVRISELKVRTSCIALAGTLSDLLAAVEKLPISVGREDPQILAALDTIRSDLRDLGQQLRDYRPHPSETSIEVGK